MTCILRLDHTFHSFKIGGLYENTKLCQSTSKEMYMIIWKKKSYFFVDLTTTGRGFQFQGYNIKLRDARTDLSAKRTNIAGLSNIHKV